MMNIFKTEIEVNGVVKGEVQVVNEIFAMSNISPTGSNFAPFTVRVLNKKELDLLISELKAISDQLEVCQQKAKFKSVITKAKNEFIKKTSASPNTLLLDRITWEKVMSHYGYSTEDSSVGRFMDMKIKVVNDKNEFISVALAEETI